MCCIIYSFHLCPHVSEPQSGFRIAFNMFDTDGNQIVDKREFLVVCNLKRFVLCTYDILCYFIAINKLFQW